MTVPIAEVPDDYKVGQENESIQLYLSYEFKQENDTLQYFYTEHIGDFLPDSPRQRTCRIAENKILKTSGEELFENLNFHSNKNVFSCTLTHWKTGNVYNFTFKKQPAPSNSGELTIADLIGIWKSNIMTLGSIQVYCTYEFKQVDDELQYRYLEYHADTNKPLSGTEEKDYVSCNIVGNKILKYGETELRENLKFNINKDVFFYTLTDSDTETVYNFIYRKQ